MVKGTRPEQAALSRDTDMSRTEDTRRVIEGMVDGLNDHRIDDMALSLLTISVAGQQGWDEIRPA